jgi:hypothetical protein
MISIEEFNLGFVTINEVSIEIQPFKTNPETVNARLYMSNNGTPVVNYEGTPIGVNYVIPADIVTQWENDDTPIEDYILNLIGLKRA